MDLRVYRSESPVAAFVVAPGAGAGQNSPFMTRAARRLAGRGVSCATFDFTYRAAGRRAPDPALRLEARWREAIDEAERLFPGLPLVIGGKSMGGRIASHVAAAGRRGLAGLVFLGYPLHPPGKPQQRRDAHLPAIAEPMLFVQGSRDAFGTADEIRALLPRLQRAALHEVPGADHSFKVGRGADDPVDGVLDAVAEWIRAESFGAVKNPLKPTGEREKRR
jgi:predicted alpha/beta-hydrolase family hydrolase